MTPPQAPTAAQAAKRDALAAQLNAAGWSPGLCRLSGAAQLSLRVIRRVPG